MTNIEELTMSEALELGRRVSARIKVLGRPSMSHVERAVKYAALDWNKTNNELSKEHRLCLPTVCKWRKALGHPKRTKFSLAAPGWDWGNTDTEIARENKLGLATVKIWRLKLGKPEVKRELAGVNGLTPRAKVTRQWGTVNWAGLDWALQDIHLARKVGCTREYIRQRRAQLGLPKTHASEYKYQQFIKKLGERKSVTSGDCDELGISVITLAKYCARAGITLLPKVRTYPKKLYPWEQFNWDLPNKILTEIWRVRANGLAIHRSNFCKPKAKFKSDLGRVPVQWEATVKAERAKAQEHFAELNGKHENP